MEASRMADPIEDELFFTERSRAASPVPMPSPSAAQLPPGALARRSSGQHVGPSFASAPSRPRTPSRVGASASRPGTPSRAVGVASPRPSTPSRVGGGSVASALSASGGAGPAATPVRKRSVATPTSARPTSASPAVASAAARSNGGAGGNGQRWTATPGTARSSAAARSPPTAAAGSSPRTPGFAPQGRGGAGVSAAVCAEARQPSSGDPQDVGTVAPASSWRVILARGGGPASSGGQDQPPPAQPRQPVNLADYTSSFDEVLRMISA